MANEKKLSFTERQAELESLIKQRDKFTYGTILKELGKNRAEQLAAIKFGRENAEGIQSIKITIERGYKNNPDDNFMVKSSTLELIKDDSEMVQALNTGSLEDFRAVIGKTVAPDNSSSGQKSNVLSLWNDLEDTIENLVSGQNNRGLHLLQSQKRFQNAKLMWENHIKAEACPNPGERLAMVNYKIKEQEDYFAKMEEAAAG